jgi:hypothetical protein
MCNAAILILYVKIFLVDINVSTLILIANIVFVYNDKKSLYFTQNMHVDPNNKSTILD